VRRLTLIAAALLLAACSKDIQNTDAVKQGVVDYLRGRMTQTGLNVDSLQVDVTSVAFQKDQARATVAIRPKTGDSGGPMMMSYVLDRKGSKWVVRGRTENGVNPHGQTAPGDGSETPPSGTLPPGHPPIGAQK
jgi:hypothetical protein